MNIATWSGLLTWAALSAAPPPAAVDAGSAQAQKAPNELPAPEYLPREARALLKGRMAHHGFDMSRLSFAVILLQYKEAEALAASIAGEPQLARPLPGSEGDLNSLLPERFFVLQKDSQRRARDVERAAAKADDKALALAFGNLSQTCVACHSVYLRGPSPSKSK